MRTYCPVGDLVAGMAYLVRRLLENTSNESFLYEQARGVPLEELLARPRRLSRVADAVQERADPRAAAGAGARAADGRAGGVRRRAGDPGAGLGRRRTRAPAARWSRSTRASRSGSWRESAVASEADVDHALDLARPQRLAARTAATQRAEVLITAAAWLRERRLEIAALEVRETAKPWREADGDVCEAIDFLEYYARAAIALERASGGLPGTPAPT